MADVVDVADVVDAEDVEDVVVSIPDNCYWLQVQIEVQIAITLPI